MKKYIFFFVALLFFTTGNAKPKVVATASMLQDMAKNIAGDHAEVLCIVPIGGDPHIHEPTSKDAKLVSSADLVLMNGLTFEGWLNKLIANSGTKAKVATITEGVKVIQSDSYANSPDPHAWMDATNGIVYAENIKKALIDLMPDHKADFENNFNKYKKELEETHQYILNQINKIPDDKRIVITSHDAFQYFGKAYGLTLESVMGISTEEDVQTSTMIALGKLIEEKNVPAVFIESTINPKLLKQFAKDKGIHIGGELFADSLGEPETPAGTYTGMLKYNTDVIVGGLTKEKVLAEVKEEATGSNWLWIGLLGLGALGLLFFIIRKMNG